MSLSSKAEWELNFRVYSENELKSTYTSLVSDLQKSPQDRTAIELLDLVEKEMERRGIMNLP